MAWFDKALRSFDEAFAGFGDTLDVYFQGKPAADHLYQVVSDDDEKIVVTIDVPGVRRNNLTLQTKGAWLTIAGKREGRKDFTLRLRMNSDLDPEGVEAALADGVLTVTAKKVQPESKGRTIPIK